VCFTEHVTDPFSFTPWLNIAPKLDPQPSTLSPMHVTELNPKQGLNITSTLDPQRAYVHMCTYVVRDTG
jgi:hypothetical protein